MSDHDDAARYAAAAGDLLLALHGDARDDTTTRRSLGDTGDSLANQRLLELLHREHPDDPVLSEESVDDTRRHDAARVWIIDPLDGTREFCEEGRSDWAVHVALWVRERGVSAGAVALPAQGITLSTASPPVVPARAGSTVRVIVSRTRPPVVAQRVATELGAELVEMGSAGAKTMAVVQGHADVYVHAGGQYEWDSAAPVAVAATAGLWASRLDGSALAYNRPDPWLPDLVVCRRELADVVLAAAES